MKAYQKKNNMWYAIILLSEDNIKNEKNILYLFN